MMQFSFRKALNDDAAVICSIISQNQAIMHDEGRTQWQDGYPNKETIAADIAAGIGLVLVDAGKVIGYCVLITTGEPHYDTIEGKWLTQSNSHDCRYAVVHRLAVNPSLAGRGIATQWLSQLIDEAAKRGCESMRIDTNFDNVQMLRILPKLGFTRCGTVTLWDGSRIAFEKVIANDKL
jgi:GNAT superfamily N-acetyltransferase